MLVVNLEEGDDTLLGGASSRGFAVFGGPCAAPTATLIQRG